MTRRYLFATGSCLVAAAALLSLAAIRSAAQTQQAAAIEGGREIVEGEVLTSGPMHEAFAKALPANPEPGIVVPDQPPEPIEEIPPDQRPAEEDVVWIPGYWGWDENHEGFVWISGVWRVSPPGAEWVPGYWARVDDGYQWISGYWWYQQAPAAEEAVSQEVVYLPEPPATLEAGPSSPVPSEEHFWIPGCWMWQDARYVWRPGYWAVGVPEWVWIPAHYVWSPSGCIFVAGHWDYTLERRGMLFAPVYFERVVYTRPAFRYVPTVVINTTVLQTSLFIRPRYCHYYFGDYYAPAYRNVGIVAWFSFHGERRGYDPLFTYHYWRHGRDRTWLAGLRETYEYRAEHVEARPPRTYRDMHRWMERQPAEETVRLAARLHEVDEMKDMSVRLRPVNEQQRQRYVHLKDEMREFTRQRASIERDLHERAPEHRAEEGRDDSRVAAERGPRRVKLPESPFSQFRPDRRTEDLTGRRERLQRADREAAGPGLAGEAISPRPSQASPEAETEQAGQAPAEAARPDMPSVPQTAAERSGRGRQRPDRVGPQPDLQPGAQPETAQQAIEQPQSPQAAMPEVPGIASEGSQRPDRAGGEARPQGSGVEAEQPGLPQRDLDQRPAMPELPTDASQTPAPPQPGVAPQQPRVPGTERSGGPATERPSEAAEMPSPPQPGVVPQRPDAAQPGRDFGRSPGADRQLQLPPRPEGTADPFGERLPRGRDRGPSEQRMPQAQPGAPGGAGSPVFPGIPSAADRPAAGGQPAESLFDRSGRGSERMGAGVRPQESPGGLGRPQLPAAGMERPRFPAPRETQPSPQLPTPGAPGFSPGRPLDRESGRRSRTPFGTPPTRETSGFGQPRPDAQSPLPGMPGLESGRRSRSSDSRPDFRSRLDALQGQQPGMPDRGRPSASPRSGSIPRLEGSPRTTPGMVPGSPPSDRGGSRERSARSRAPEGPSAAEPSGRARPSESGRRERAGRSDRGRDRDDDD